MIQCRLLISSEDYYTCQLTREIPVRVTIVTINLPAGFAIIEPLAGGEETLKRYVNAMHQSASIIKFDITRESPDGYWTRSVHQLDYPSIYETILESGSMTLLPVIIEKGVQNHNILSPSPKALESLLRTLNTRFTNVKIKQLHSRPGSLFPSLLTDKQLEAFKIAHESGYYSVPRKTKVTELAKKIGIKRVAMQERLRRVEMRIMKDYADRILY
ncbi:MAG: helix-turn-helix domain-containing protein [Candidatus Odinarchaeota archaeon]